MSGFDIVDLEMGVQIQNVIGTFNVGAARTLDGGSVYHHLLIYKNLSGVIPLRFQSGCALGNIAGDLECDCNGQLHEAMAELHRKNRGLIIYTFEDDGRGRGLISKLKVYRERQRSGVSGKQACVNLNIDYDVRNYTQQVAIVKRLGITSVKLLSSCARKAHALACAGIVIETAITI